MHSHPFDKVQDVQGSIQVHLHGVKHAYVVSVPFWLEVLTPEDFEHELLEGEALESRDLDCV